MLLKHSLYIITGANRGFGKAIAETIAAKAKNKTTVVLVGRDASQLERIQLDNTEISCHIIANVSLEGAKEAQETVIDKLDQLLKSWKETDVAPITNAYLINNAGSIGDLSKKISDYTVSEIQDYVSFNISSYVALVSGFIRLLNNGLIELTVVNISSLLAVQAFSHFGLYATGKSARDMLLQVLAKEEVRKKKKAVEIFIQD
ncbi:uncharacterized protein B0P05DRAFT_558928 [Gilbertella persicaria]|uniref:uncharacterized protein n=1 Tax=Gilbertella persicaria TaxID=101096 RepID=UPI00221F2820|nr:uncharacterized protein B0P05DRAFT_558928 [Gilbertella persicaria]KAI8059060.1 hypothetical protein B0P05DRAFT_558928 [Gilbertella persicaria]